MNPCFKSLSFWSESLFASKPKTLNLYSLLSQPECVSRINAAIDPRRSWFFPIDGKFGTKPVIGTVNISSLKIRKVIYERNSFQRILRGKIVSEGEGTLIICEIGIDPIIQLFIRFWMTGVILFFLLSGVIFLIKLLMNSGKINSNDYISLLIPLIMVLFACALVKIGKCLSEDEPDFLVDYLAQVIEAKVL